MLFTEQDLSMTNAMDILNEANYLSESESMINPKTIPVKEVSRIGYGVVRFDDVDRLAENYGCDYIDAMYAIAEASDMNPEYLAVAVPEEDIIAYPEIVNELANIVIQPLSEDSFAYQYVDMCLEAWDNTGDEDYLEAIVEDYCLEEAAMLLTEMTHDQWLSVVNNPDLSDAQKEALGKRFYGKDVTDMQLAANVRMMTKPKSTPHTQTVSPDHPMPQSPQQTQNQDPRKPTGVFFGDDGFKKLGAGMRGKKHEPVNTPPKQNTLPIPLPVHQQQEPPKSNTPLEDNKGKPAQSKPNTGGNTAAPAGGGGAAPAGGGNTAAGGGNTAAGGGGRFSSYWNSIKGAYGKAGSDIKAAWGQEGIGNKAKALGKAAWENKAVVGGTAVGVAGLGAAIYVGQKYIREARNKPKSWIGKKIAALRSVYQKWMQAAQKNPKKAGAIKSAAAKLLAIIDALLAKMQKAAG